MNMLDRIAAMAREIVAGEGAELPRNVGITLMHRSPCDPETKWHASVDVLNASLQSSGATPEDALRGVDAKLTKALEDRIARAQEKIHRARMAMLNEGVSTKDGG